MTGVTDAKDFCHKIYALTRKRYAEVQPDLGLAALGYRILYAPPTVGAPYLFLGYQPAGTEAESDETWPEQNFYTMKNWRFSKRVRSIWGAELVNNCTGLNAIFFRAPSVAAWLRVEKPLRRELEEFSIHHAEEIVRILRPKCLVVIGLGTFNRLLKGQPCLFGERGRVLAKKGYLWGCQTIGTIHITGARINNVDRDHLRTYFTALDSNCPSPISTP
jgi:hypothetical protein